MSGATCPTCQKTAYPAESITVKGHTYHKFCLKCVECGTRLTLTTYKVSDFGQPDIYCNKCVPRVAPCQADKSVEMDRTKRAKELTAEVRMVNEQVRGADETTGKPFNPMPK